MNTTALTLSFTLPTWINEHIDSYKASSDLNKRMAFVLEAARIHVSKKTGGPFAAGVFEQESGRLVSLGVNLVPSEGISCLHAEVVALSLAQKRLGTFNLGSEALPALELLTSTEPCAMCLGAIPWSGIPKVVCAARGDDAIAIGFDEGDKPSDWTAKLQARGVKVSTDYLRDEAKAILQAYHANAGEIYNGG